MGISIYRKSDFVEQRRAGRARLDLEIALRERGRMARLGRLFDFTPLGCRVTEAALKLADGQVWIKLPTIESQLGRVTWQRGDSFGIEFAAPLHPSVAASFLPTNGSYAAITTSGLANHSDQLLSRREQILQGFAAADHSPLQRRKKPKGMGMLGKIARGVVRQVDHRNETRFTDAVNENDITVTINDVAVRIINLSSSGLRVAAPLECEIGDSVTVVFDGFPPMEGQVVWINGEETGVALPPDSIDLHED